MSHIKKSTDLCINNKLVDLFSGANAYTTGSIVSYPYDTYKLSVISTKPITIIVIFHHEKNNLSYKSFSLTLVANVYSYLVNLVEGEKMSISIHDNGQTITDSDTLNCNVYLSTNSTHLITI